MIRMKNPKVRFEKYGIVGGSAGLALLISLAGDCSIQSTLRATVTMSPPGVAINIDDWQSLAEAVRIRAARFGGTAGYIIKDFKSGQVAPSNSELVFPSASLIKL